MTIAITASLNASTRVLSVSLTLVVLSGMSVFIEKVPFGSSIGSYLDHGVGEGLWCFLRQIVADARD